MSFVLKNQSIQINVDEPIENYQAARFDWTGKITGVSYNGMAMTGQEYAKNNKISDGKGLYNEFGINRPIGFEDAKTGDWFHKIGIGLLKKNSDKYDFKEKYTIHPAHFEIKATPDRILLTCQSESHNGYAYLLKKHIELRSNGFSIHYELMNQGSKPIHTNEYTHNFISLDAEPIDSDYQLALPFKIQPTQFEETVNPGNLVDIKERMVKFKNTPSEPYFFSNLSGDAEVTAGWSLTNHKRNIGIQETASFKTTQINLWGCGHVISPELFMDIYLPPGKTTQWSRNYQVFDF